MKYIPEDPKYGLFACIWVCTFSERPTMLFAAINMCDVGWMFVLIILVRSTYLNILYIIIYILHINIIVFSCFWINGRFFGFAEFDPDQAFWPWKKHFSEVMVARLVLCLTSIRAGIPKKSTLLERWEHVMIQ